MSVLLNRRVLLAGLASWLGPLLVSMGFFDREGNLTVAAGLFHSVMSVVLAGVVAWAMVWVGRAVPLTAGAGLAIGLLWLALNVVLDALVLLPMTGMGAGAWVQDVGLRYLAIPLLTAAIGAAVSSRSSPPAGR
jgi:hypothetical protein